MKYASTTKNNINGTDYESVVVVKQLSEVPGWNPDEPVEGTYLVPDDVGIGWVFDAGRFVPPPPPLPPPPPTLEQIIQSFTDSVQKRLDDFARTRNYDGILSACTYSTSHNPQFKAEGQCAADARDATWASCYQIMEAVLSGERPMPTLDELLSELPKLEWPE